MKRSSRFAVAVMACLLALSAHAKEKEGVVFGESAVVDGKTLKLNGIGLRTKLFFKVYVAGLYLETPTKDAKALLEKDSGRRVQMVMLRDLEKKSIVDAIREGFDKNAKAQMPKLKDRLDTFVALVPDLKKGEQLTITYDPAKGTTLTAGDKEATVEGKDFSDALFSVWLGASPVDDDLKKGMLGG